jgi:FAD-dependent urate hydroxylase
VNSYEVAIVGAGPYGLAAVAHLRAKRVDCTILGNPMSFWREMPEGMLLRSPYVACDIADPDRALTLDHYVRAHGQRRFEPVPLDLFINYGKWFQQRVAPDADRRSVEQIDPVDGAFRLVISDGTAAMARNVVIAAGIAQFAHRPRLFRGLPRTLVSHTLEQPDLGLLGRRRVLVIGGGQSALESAALLHECGADVEVYVREPTVRWLTRRWQHHLGPVTKMLYAPPDVGPAFVSHLVARPGLYRRLPRDLQDGLCDRSICPAGAAWLVPRIQEIPINVGRAAVAAELNGSRVRVRFDDGGVRTVDHVLLGTGYRVDVARYPFLPPTLLASLKRVDGHPVLSTRFESSVRGLFFLGAPAARSFGPLMRFVAGTEFAARAIAHAIRPGSA